MENNTLYFLDYFFLVFHTIFSIFNMTGWAFRRTRRVHLATMLLTAFSWFVLGIFYGWGYCFCTDWHWQVREAMGNPIESYSYIHFLILEISGKYMDPDLVNITVLAVFIFAFIMTIFMNVRDFRKKYGTPSSGPGM